MRRFVVLIVAAAIILGWFSHAPAAIAGSPCVGAAGTTCGVTADPSAQEFHGLLAVTGAPWVLATAADAGTTAGCGDCTWDIVLACPDESPTDPGSVDSCTTLNHSAICQPGQLLYRVYLSTDASADVEEGSVCLGGADQPVPVGEIAQADVARYLQDVTPPDLAIRISPDRATLAGLPTYFAAHPPAGLRPTAFGGPDVTETITISPVATDWSWGDGATSGWSANVATVSHTYRRGGVERGQLLTRWGATYTITYAGETFGPYDATGQLTAGQRFRLPVRTTSPVLVSR